MFTLPHHTVLAVFSSSTTNLSLGDLPVNFPVFIAKAPLLAITPSFKSMLFCMSSSAVKFQWACKTLCKPNDASVAFFAFVPVSFMKKIA